MKAIKEREHYHLPVNQNINGFLVYWDVCTFLCVCVSFSEKMCLCFQAAACVGVSMSICVCVLEFIGYAEELVVLYLYH